MIDVVYIGALVALAIFNFIKDTISHSKSDSLKACREFFGAGVYIGSAMILFLECILHR
jgi:hypothetical protein